MEKLFRIIDGKDNSSVLGGDVSADNAAFTMGLHHFVTVAGTRTVKSVNELELNESVYAQFQMSHNKGIYEVLRVQ